MVNYFHGPDTYGARQAISKAAADSVIRWVDREDIERQSLTAILDQSGSSLFGKQLVVVRDPSALPKSLQEGVINAIKASADTEWIAWDRSKPDKRSKLYAALKKHQTEFPVMPELAVQKWITQTYPGVTPQAARELVTRCGTDRWRIASETEKLLVTCNPLEVDHVREHIPLQEVSEEIFPYLDAVSSGNTSRALQSLENLLRDGSSELYVLSMLGYQYKTLFAIVSGKTEKLHSFVVQKSASVASKYTKESVRNILARLAATDFAIKQGKMDQRTAITMLTLALSSEAKQKSRP